MAPVGRVISASKQKNQIKNFVFPKDIGPHGLLMIFRDFEYQPVRSTLGEVPVPTIGASVLLPLPRQIVDSTGVRLSVAELGVVGEIIAEAVSQGKGSIAATQQALAALVPDASKIGENLGSFFSGNASQMMADSANSAFSQSNFLLRKAAGAFFDTRSLDLGFGNAINPKQALTFQGVNMREYDFDFELMPQSPDESDLIRNIANLIRSKSLPAYQDLQGGDQVFAERVFLSYPSMVDLYFVGIDAEYYFHFKTCMVSRCTINLAPTGGNQHAILRGGKPAIVTMNISFSETDIRVRSDYEDKLEGIN